MSAVATSYNALAATYNFKKIELTKPSEQERVIVKQIKEDGLAIEHFGQNKEEMRAAIEQSSVAQSHKVDTKNLEASTNSLDLSALTDESGQPLSEQDKAEFPQKLLAALP